MMIECALLVVPLSSWGLTVLHLHGYQPNYEIEIIVSTLQGCFDD